MVLFFLSLHQVVHVNKTYLSLFKATVVTLLATFLTACLSIGGLGADATSEPQSVPKIDNKFVPSSDKALWFIGQDISSIQGYMDLSINAPAGVNGYITASGTGVYQRLDGAYGPLDLQAYLAGYTHSALSLGLWMADSYALIAKGDAKRRGMVDDIIDELKASNRPVFLRIGYEVDGYWNAYEPEAFKKAWKYIVETIKRKQATNIATVWQISAYCSVRGENNNLGNTTRGLDYDAWWPDDPSTVDWVAFPYFDQARSCAGNQQAGGLPEAFGRLGDVDELTGQSLALDHVMAYLKSKEKPIMIAESAPKGYDLNLMTVVENSQSRGASPQNIPAREVWDGWFEPFFGFIRKNQKSIKAVSYTNMEWNAHPGWFCDFSLPVKENNCANGYWGDSRIQANTYLWGLWQANLTDKHFISVAKPGMFEQLTGWKYVARNAVKQTAYTNEHIPHALPGKIEAEHFDNGGQRVAYLDTAMVETGLQELLRSTVRSSRVRKAIQKNSCRSNESVSTLRIAANQCVVVGTEAGEWLEYSVMVENAFEGNIYLNVAAVDGGGLIRVELDGKEVSSPVEVPNTNSWSTFSQVEIKGVRFRRGEHQLRLVMHANGQGESADTVAHINSIKVINPNNKVSFFGEPISVPGRLETEWYNHGGEGVSFHDSTPKDLAAGPGINCAREGMVDLGSDGTGACVLSWVSVGEWLEYDIVVTEVGTYKVAMRSTSLENGGTFDILLNGEPLLRNVKVPQTGGWMSYSLFEIGQLSLKPGEYTMRINFTKNGNQGESVGNIDYFEFTKQ